jgi:alpha-glucosidase
MAQIFSTYSPDASLRVDLEMEESTECSFSVFQNNDLIFPRSALGILTSIEDFRMNFHFVSTQTGQVTTVYQPRVGKQTEYTNLYSSRVLTLRSGGSLLRILLRVYNDGLAYCYQILGTGTAVITSEYSTFQRLPQTGGWGQLQDGRLQYLSPSDLIKHTLALPLLLSIDSNAHWALLTQSNLVNEYSYLRPIGTSLCLCRDREETHLPLQTPWHIAVISKTLTDLVHSVLVENTDPEYHIQTPWGDSGRCATSSWEDSCFTPSLHWHKQMVDFAAKMKWEYVIVGNGWADWTDGTVAQLCEYAKEFHVGIFIQAVGSLAENADERYYADDYLDELCREVKHIQTWAQWGIRGIIVNLQGNKRVSQRISSLCASQELMVLYEPFQSETVDSYHNCTLPFVGGMAPVVIRIQNKRTSEAHQLAMAIICHSGMQIFADSTAFYKDWIGTELLQAIPGTWDEIQLLDGFPGEFVILARRSGNRWFIGGITSGKRNISFNLSFLQSGTFLANIYRDGDNAQSLAKQIITVNSETRISLSLLQSGGFAILIR